MFTGGILGLSLPDATWALVPPDAADPSPYTDCLQVPGRLYQLAQDNRARPDTARQRPGWPKFILVCCRFV